MAIRRRHKEFHMLGAQVARGRGVLYVRRTIAGRSATPRMGCLCRLLDGFTLLEVLVSLSIVAIAVTVVLQLFSADLRALYASEDYVSAVLRAESRMRELLDDEALPATSWSETTRDGYTMDVSVSDVMQDRTDSLPMRLVRVDLTTRWIRGTKQKSLTLRTMKILNRPAGFGERAGGASSKPAGGTAAPSAAASGTATPKLEGK